MAARIIEPPQSNWPSHRQAKTFICRGSQGESSWPVSRGRLPTYRSSQSRPGNRHAQGWDLAAILGNKSSPRRRPQSPLPHDKIPQNHQDDTNRKRNKLDNLIRHAGLTPSIQQVKHLLHIFHGIRLVGIPRIHAAVGVSTLVRDTPLVEQRVVELSIGIRRIALDALEADGPGDTAGHEEERADGVDDHGDEGGDLVDEEADDADCGDDHGDGACEDAVAEGGGGAAVDLGFDHYGAEGDDYGAHYELDGVS